MSDHPQSEPSRRLAAIMFTDMVSYSALTQRNEAVALALLAEHNSLIRTALKAHAGREIKTVGDAFLVEFASALEAVRCAIRIQREFSARNANVAGEPIRIRIGVHLGDVVYREGDVFGDGVNIAARVQSSCEAGQIRLSEDVARQVGNKLEYPLMDLGLKPLKNIEQPMHIFSVALPWEAIDEPSADLAATDAANAKVTTLPSHSSLAPASISTALQAMARNRIAMLGVVAVTVALTATFFAYRYLASANSKTIESIAVLPFENATGDPAIDYLSDGISESLINKLASLNGLRVISRTSAFALKGKKLDPIEIGKKLGVDALILGNLVQRGTSLTISSELVRASNATQLWGEKYIRQADDVLKVEGEIAATIAQTLRRQLSGTERARLTRTATDDPEAYRLYLKGRDFLVGNQQEMDKSVDYFQRAVARAPNYATAHAGLAEAYARQAYLRAAGRAETAGKARTAVNRALELDPDLAEAHNALGVIRFFLDWDWAGAETEFRRALELNPGSAAVHDDFGVFLTSMGRLDEGLAQSQEAVRLDPLSIRPLHDIAVNALARNDYDLAAAGFRRALALDPNWAWGYVKLGRTLAIQKKCSEAFVQAEMAEKKIGNGAAVLARSWIGATYAICGDVARARQKLAELHALEKIQYVDPVTFGEIHSSLGEMDQALHWYEKAFEDRTPNMVYALLLFRLNPALGATPRFKAIIERMKFPKP